MLAAPDDTDIDVPLWLEAYRAANADGTKAEPLRTVAALTNSRRVQSNVML